MSTAKKNDIIAEVNGLQIRQNSLYKVEPKYDADAPDGFREEGTTKLPSEGITTESCCPFSLEANLYDTGLYIQSPCYRYLNAMEVSAVVKNLTTYIVKPFEAVYGEGTLKPQNTEFWDSYNVSLEEGLVFNTEEVSQLLDLYIAMRGNSLMPVSEAGNPKFLNAQYAIKDATKSVSVKKERVMLKMDSISAFKAMLLSEKSLLIDVLKYLDIVRTSITPDELDMNIAFSEWIDKDPQNPKIFLDLHENVKQEKGEQKVRLRVRVSQAISKGIIKKTTSGEYLHESIPLGIDIKSIVYNLQNDKELSEILDKILMT